MISLVTLYLQKKSMKSQKLAEEAKTRCLNKKKLNSPATSENRSTGPSEAFWHYLWGVSPVLIGAMAIPRRNQGRLKHWRFKSCRRRVIQQLQVAAFFLARRFYQLLGFVERRGNFDNLTSAWRRSCVLGRRWGQIIWWRTYSRFQDRQRWIPVKIFFQIRFSGISKRARTGWSGICF